MKQRTINDYCKMNLIKNLTAVILLFATVMTLSAKTSRIDSLSLQMQILEQQIGEKQQKITIIQKELGIYEKEMSAICEHVDRSNEEISNQIAASSHTIQAWGWIIAIMAFVFGFYINRMWKKISDATAKAKEQLDQAEETFADITKEQKKVNDQQQEVKKIQEDTEEKLKELQNLHSDIQNNMSAIYEKMKREETIALLKRLEEIPEDITNVGDILLTRQFVKNDFEIMLNAYHNLISRSLELNGLTSISELRGRDEDFRSLEGSYILQFAQHFMEEAIVDKELQSLLRSRFRELFSDCFFRNDAEKSTTDFKKGVSTLNIQSQKSLIADFLLAIAQSHYAKFEELYNTLLLDLTESNIQKIWEKISSDKKNAVYLAQYLKKLIGEKNFSTEFLANIDAYIQNAESASPI